MPTLIKIIRLFFALIAIWQLFGLLPALSWLPDLPSIGSEVWALLMIKVGALVISAAIYFALRAIGKRYPASGAGPSDAKIIVATVIAIPVLGFVAAVVTPILSGNNESRKASNNQVIITPAFCRELVQPTIDPVRPGLFDGIASDEYINKVNSCRAAGYKIGMQPWERNGSQ